MTSVVVCHGSRSSAAQPRTAKTAAALLVCDSTHDRVAPLSSLLHPIRRQKHPDRAGDDLADALGRGSGGGLEDEGQEQARLARQLELRGGELTVLDREFACLHAAF